LPRFDGPYTLTACEIPYNNASEILPRRKEFRVSTECKDIDIGWRARPLPDRHAAWTNLNVTRKVFVWHIVQNKVGRGKVPGWNRRRRRLSHQAHRRQCNQEPHVRLYYPLCGSKSQRTPANTPKHLIEFRDKRVEIVVRQARYVNDALRVRHHRGGEIPPAAAENRGED
jgi:hypothetical protein